jgi:hypothetical protein
MAELLEKVAKGTISPADALVQTNAWVNLPWDERIFADAWHALKHFEIDRDASLKDPKLAQIQRTALLNWAAQLRAPR